MIEKQVKYVIFVLILIGKYLPYHSLYDLGYNSIDGNDAANDSTASMVRLNGRSYVNATPRPIGRSDDKWATKPRVYPDVSFPPFHSNTSISKNDVRVKDPSLLECAGTHRYCVNKATNESNAKGVYCSCQVDCHKYGDCCWDAPKPPLPIKLRDKEYPLPEWRRKCLEIGTGAFSRESFFVTNACPERYEDNEYKKYCQESYPEKGGAMTNHQLLVWVSRRLPVISLTSNVTYANVFCAICNDAKRVTPWELLPVNCTYPNETLYSRDSWSQFAQSNPSLTSLLRYCSIVYRKPEASAPLSNEKIRACDNEVLEECSYSGTDETRRHLAKRCQSFYAPVEARSKNVKVKFKNKFCAFCAGFSERDLNCVAGGGHSVNRFKAPGSELPAMSLFFDFSLTYSGDGDQSGSGISCLNKGRVGEKSPELSVTLGKREITKNRRKWCLLGSSLYEKECYSGTIEASPPVSRDACLRIDRLLTVTCLGASLVALVAKFICYLAMKRSVSLASRCVLSLAVSVFVYQSLLLVASNSGDIPGACQAAAIAVHYFFLASFFWMNVLAYDVHRTFSSPYEIQKRNAKRRLIAYNLYAWSSPALIVVSAVALDYASHSNWLKPNYGRSLYGVCWISNKRALIFFFAAPLTLLLLVNWAFFVAVSFKIASTAKSASKAMENSRGNEKDRLRLALFVKLALLMGLTWILGIISSYGNSDSLRYSYIAVNGLQGVFIFFAFARVPWKSGFRRIHRFVGSINLERSSFSRGQRSDDDSGTTLANSAKV